MHRDIKPENILVERDPSGTVNHSYLIDFGLSTFEDYNGPEKQMWGTLGYSAPEVFQEDGYSHTIDIWEHSYFKFDFSIFSLGIVFYFLVTGELPFDDPSDNKIIELTTKNALPFKSSKFSHLDQRLPELLQDMTNKSPSARITIKECLNHPYFNS